MFGNTSKLRHWTPRFSLRTLLILVMLFGSAATVWRHWEPWFQTFLIHDVISQHVADLASFTPDGKRIIVKESGGQIHVLDAYSHQHLIAITQSTSSAQLELSKDRRFLLMSDQINTEPRKATLWNTQTGDLITDLGQQNIRDSFSDDSQLIVTTGSHERSYVATVWNSESGRKLHELSKPKSAIVFAWFSPATHRVITKSGSGEIVVWDGETGRELTPVKSDEIYWIFSRDRRRAWGNGELFDTSSWQSLRFIGSDNHDRFCDPVFSGDSKKVLAVLQNVPTIFDANLGEKVAILECEGSIDGLRLSSTGDRAITISTGTAILWDGNTGRVIRRFEDPDNAGIMDATFTLDDSRIITMGNFASVRIWDARSGACMANLKLSPEIHIKNFEFWAMDPIKESPDNNQLLLQTGTPDIALWQRRRPEYWWGVAWLPEFWLTVVLSIGLIWSVWRDRRIP